MICVKCFETHRNHVSVSLNEKTCEIRQVFELLSEWKKNEKQAVGTSKSISIIVGNHKNCAEALIKKIEDLLDKVKENLTSEVRVRLNEFQELEKRSKKRVEVIGKIQKDLRVLLAQSNGTMVSMFPLMKSSVDAMKKK